VESFKQIAENGSVSKRHFPTNSAAKWLASAAEPPFQKENNLFPARSVSRISVSSSTICAKFSVFEIHS